jgi:hypothetical protein
LYAPIKYFEDIGHGVYTSGNIDEQTVPMRNIPKAFKPKLSLLVLASLATLCLNATAQQVYESTDAQGNVSFSDSPTPGSRAVTIEAPNLSDAVKVPPPSPDTETEQAPQPEPQPAAASGQVPPDLSTTDDNNNYNDNDGGDYLYPDRRYDRKLIDDERRNLRRFPRPEPRGGR